MSQTKPEATEQKSFYLTFDRIESGARTAAVAVLLDPQGVSLNVPASFLPDAARPGDVLLVTLQRDQHATRQVAEQTRRLQDDLKQTDPGGDIRL